MKAVFAGAGPKKEDTMKTKEAINILNHAVEYFDMNYNTGNKRDTTWEISKVWKALNHVASELEASSNKHQAKVYTERYIEWRKRR